MTTGKRATPGPIRRELRFFNLNIHLRIHMCLEQPECGQRRRVHDQMQATLEESAKTPVLQLRLIPLIGELQGDDQAAEAADKFLANQPPANLVHNVKILRAIYRGKILDATEADALQTRYGFFGDVAAAHLQSDDSPLQVKLKREELRAFWGSLGAALG